MVSFGFDQFYIPKLKERISFKLHDFDKCIFSENYTTARLNKMWLRCVRKRNYLNSIDFDILISKLLMLSRLTHVRVKFDV